METAFAVILQMFNLSAPQKCLHLESTRLEVFGLKTMYQEKNKDLSA